MPEGFFASICGRREPIQVLRRQGVVVRGRQLDIDITPNLPSKGFSDQLDRSASHKSVFAQERRSCYVNQVRLLMNSSTLIRHCRAPLEKPFGSS